MGGIGTPIYQTPWNPWMPTPIRGGPSQPRMPTPQLYDPYSPDSRRWLYESVVSRYPPEVTQPFPPVWQGLNQYTWYQPPPTTYLPPRDGLVRRYQYMVTVPPPTTYFPPEDGLVWIDQADFIPSNKIGGGITNPLESPTILPVPTTTPDEEKRKKQFYDREYGYYYEPAGYGGGIER